MARVLGIALAILTLAGVSIPAESQGWRRSAGNPVTPVILAGDLDRDGAVNLLDLLRLRDFVLRREVPSAEELESGDLNADGRLDDRDLKALEGLVLRVKPGTGLGQSGAPEATAGEPPTIANGTFEDGLTSWQVYRSSTSNSIVAEADPELPGNTVARFRVQNTSGSGWHLNLVQAGNQGPLNLTPNTTYMIRFRARASSDRILKLELSVSQGGYRNLGLLEYVNLTTLTRSYSVTFRTVDNLPSSGILLSFLATPVLGDTWVDDVTIEPVGVTTFAGTEFQIASFDGGESWDGGAIDMTHVQEGDAGLQLNAPVNGFGYVSREVALDLSQTPWEMTLWVYTETPEAVGRLLLAARSGSDTDPSYVAWAVNGLASGWNQVVIPDHAFFGPYWFVNNFTWQTARTLALELEANANGAASVTVDDLRVEPASGLDRRNPVVSHVNIVDVGPTTATIRWRTPESATGVLHLGPTTAYGATVPTTVPDTTHQVVVEGLTPSTRYHCRIVATDGAGLSGASGDFMLVTEPATPPFPPDPSADFDLGLYTVYGRTDLAGLAGMPFTHVHSFQFSQCSISLSAVQDYLDVAQSSGIGVMLGLSCNPIDPALSGPILDIAKDHPATQAWYLYDEPEIHGISQEYLDTSYDLIRARDTSHPVVIAAHNFGQPEYPYSSGFDKVLLDAYPIPYAPVDWVIPRLDAAASDGRPWGFIFQAYQPDVDRWIGNSGGPTRYPTAQEMRAMPFLALNRGAQDLWAFSYNDLNDLPGSEWKWTELLAQAQELKRLRPLLASTATPTITAASSNSGIDLGIRRFGNREYVVAVNKTANPISSSISLTGVTGTTAVRMGDGVPVPMTNATLADVWTGYDVRMFEVIPLDADLVSPTLTIAEPPEGAQVGGETAVTVDADDDLLVAYVQVLVDGVPVGDPLTSEPYTIDWDAGQSTDGLHVLSAVVYDASGNFAQSDVTINVDNVLPTVSVVDPAHGSLLLESTVPVNATATDNDRVEGVQFALDGVPLGAEDTIEPYGILWDYSAVSDGSHQLSAMARDRAGNVATNAVSVSVDHLPPAVSVTVPADGAVLTGTSINVTASASDALGIAGVQFQLDGADLGARDTSSPYGVTWSGATDGSHTLTAIAEDASGRFATAAAVAVTVDNTAPPATDQVRDGTGADAQYTNSSNTLSANWDLVVDPGSGVADYQMAIGTTSGGTNTMPFTSVGNVTTYTKTGLTLSNNAMYYVSIRAVDRAGLVGPARISNGIRVDRSLPSVSITAPKNKATVKGTAVVVSASASDTYGIASVQFVLDDVNLGPADTASPYTMYWNSTTVPNGYHYLKAIATDRAGNVRTSTQIRVTVSN